MADLAATATTDLRVTIGGRNPDRMNWLVDACRARATIYGTPVSFDSVRLDATARDTLIEPLSVLNPKVVVQSASAQSPWSVDNGESEWSDLVARAGFGMTIAFHALLAWRTAGALKQAGLHAHFVNTCYPDGVNQVLASAGMPMTTGVGNVGIFSAMIGGRLSHADRAALRVLGHHRHIVEWRKPPGQRDGAPVRAWIGDTEIGEVEAMTRDIQLPYRDLNLISGASAVPVLLALAGEGGRRAHVPGPAGLPGGYPVAVDASGVRLDLPAGISRDEAVAWNLQFEDKDGVSIRDGRVVYSQKAREMIRPHSAEIADGFAVNDIEEAVAGLSRLRERLGG
ncbi:hypothetical protein FQ775_03905 [Nitratireductor mangrovi]|uniref:Saccharopine dehydrogenase NADP binding domain-containing protein n=1 Tax=Nitratireductor mangrovi TaxID=2599600 RepID=A0A5B8KVG8_9HYPH|nr:hypothetical protein [Nitratireductor mangrovi]QDY99585.1 hypothetical protein FQ775_03905 [Nitratireductor mangrovi]